MRKPLIPGGRYVEHRAGLGGFVWEGMATKIDPGGSPPTRPRFLENTRVQGGSIISRPDFAGPGAVIPGITQYNTNVQAIPEEDGVGQLSPKNRLNFEILGATSWEPAWASEFNSVGGTRLWWGSTPPLIYSPPPDDIWSIGETGAQFGFIDTDCDPVFNRVATYDSDDSWPPCIEKFNTEIFVGDFGCLRKIHLIQPPAGLAPIEVLSQPADVIVLSYPGFRTTAMIEFNGMLWLLLTDPSGATDAEIWSYDGLTAQQETVFTVSGTTGGAMAVYKNELVVTLNGEGLIHIRAADGTWSTETIVGFDSSPYLNSMVQYRDKLMIMDGVDKIYSYNGAVLALEHTIAPVVDPRTGNVPVPAYAYCCCVLNDIFYYGWTNIDLPVPVLATGGEINYWGNQPDPFDIIRLGDYTYRFVTDVSAQWDVKIGATADDTATNLKDCINKTSNYGVGGNIIGGNYFNAAAAHPHIVGTVNVGPNTITFVNLITGRTGNLEFSTDVVGWVLTDPSGGIGPLGQTVALGKFDADDPSWDDFYTRKYGLFNYAEGGFSWPAADGAVTAMAQYRGRLWLAISGVPSGNSVVMTHSVQYSTYDGWFVCDRTNHGNPDQVGYNGYSTIDGYGPGHDSDDFSGTANLEPQIFYLRSI